MHRDQRSPYVAEGGQRDRAPRDVRSRLTLRRHRPTDDHRVVIEGDPDLVQNRHHGGSVSVVERHDGVDLGPGARVPKLPGVETCASKKFQPGQDHGLARSSFAGDDGETRRERQQRFIDDADALDAQFLDHGHRLIVSSSSLPPAPPFDRQVELGY